MAGLTRAQFETELTNRGWSRYSTELETYLDWALRAVVRAAKWGDTHESVEVTDHGAGAGENKIPFSSINSGNVRTILFVYLSETDKERKLSPLPTDEFHNDWLWRDMDDSTNQGEPSHYYVYQQAVYLIPAPDQDYDFTVHYVERINAFANDGATSGLPERLDQAILLEAEAICFQRAHELERMFAAQAEARRIIFEEMGDEGGRMAEDHPRVIPYRGG
jgi:hypothetical protein